MVEYLIKSPITVTARSKAWTVFARSNAGIVNSNPTRSNDVCIVCIYSVFVLFCVCRGLETGWSPVQGVLPTVYRIVKLEKRPRSNRAVEHNNNLIKSTYFTRHRESIADERLCLLSGFIARQRPVRGNGTINPLKSRVSKRRKQGQSVKVAASKGASKSGQ
jgi:hypothetical protein